MNEPARERQEEMRMSNGTDIDPRIAHLIALAAEAQEYQTADNQEALNKAARELSEAGEGGG